MRPPALLALASCALAAMASAVPLEISERVKTLTSRHEGVPPDPEKEIPT